MIDNGHGKYNQKLTIIGDEISIPTVMIGKKDS